MITLVFYVSMCFQSQCDGFEPMSWTYSTEDESTQAYKECSILANAYEQLQDVKEVDCFIEQ